MTPGPTSQTQRDPIVITKIENNIGWITLNRPKYLNSINHQMVTTLTETLKDWEKNSEVKFVVLQGSGRAFCSGGDIQSFYYNRQQGKLSEIYQFFREEYSLNYYIKSYPKPYLSLINGYCMGGGMGISFHGGFRIVTENAILAMPETTIGFFPDVGATYFLAQLPKGIGLYLGLTGTQLNAEDSMHIGLATHLIHSSDIDKLISELKSAHFKTSAINQINDILRNYSLECTSCHMEQHSEVIERCFNETSIENIFKNLEKDNTEFSYQTLNILKTKSPTSLKVFLKAYGLAKNLSLKECIELEYRLACKFITSHDFLEGVRALLVDKDRNPQWNPSTLNELSALAVDKYFTPSKISELIL